MRLNKFLFGALYLLSSVTLGVAQEGPSVTCYAYQLGGVNVQLEYDLAQSKPVELFLEYADDTIDTLHYFSYDEQLARYELRSKSSDSFAIIPRSTRTDRHLLELILRFKGETRTLLLHNVSDAMGVFIHDTQAGDTNLRNRPKGDVVCQLSKKGTYLLSVCAAQDGWWRICGNQISVYETENEGVAAIRKSGDAWIHSSVIAMDTRNYGGQKLHLRDRPSNEGRVVYSFTKEILLRPLEWRGAWVKVQTIDKKHQGWIHSEWLCGNPLTTCA
ncbi:SH3 domain-containing protein [uncultured Porphyromonas sp.]|uniref:SH3 domain-containing protein n=1 Tax=uncultured Porphyromonas sp. TaxID=159274 RepID=UPI0026245E1A|nr:SH3 domain-containing protein [uncultured Porphyromonas sp.]